MKIHEPATIDEALEVKGRHPDAIPFAGGTDLLPLWSSSRCRPERIVLLCNCDDSKEIVDEKDGLFIGAGATHAAISQHPGVIEHFAALSDAAASIGAPAIRNMGTLGGNVANASPAADLPPALIACGAEAVLASAKNGKRSMAMENFFRSYQTTALEKDELLLGVRLVVPPSGTRSFFRKVGTRKAQACAKLSLALSARLDGKKITSIRIAAGSVAPIPLRLTDVEAQLEGQALNDKLVRSARALAAAAVTPIDDVRSTADYRRFVIAAILADCVDQMRAAKEAD